jgi:carboxyl-terminal processing protease
MNKTLSVFSLFLSFSAFAGTAAVIPGSDVNNVNYGPPVTNSAQGETIAPLSQQNLFLFGATLQAIREFYVDPVTDDTIVKNAVSGMLTNLDPHSDYLDEQDFADLKAMTDGHFSGIGVEITVDNGALLVISPIDDSPAQKAGIKAGDYIVKINGTAVEGLSLTKAINMMRGPKGAKITLTIIRKGSAQPLTFTVTRDNIKLQDVKTKFLNNHYAYIRISVFEEKTGAHLRDAVKKLFKDHPGQIYGVILDLRNNPGGVVQAAVDVANVFLDVDKVGYNKLVVYTKGRVPEAQFAGYVTGHDMFNGMPMVVLINSASASASEIVAGALQDDHRAVLVGIQSFGKGSVQTVFPLPGGKTAIKLTTARYYTPSGRSIQAEGITPDVKVNEYSIPDTVKAPDNDVVREADLSTHLQGGENDTTIGKTTTLPATGMNTSGVANLEAILNGNKDNKALIYTDYQLNQGLNILEALHAANQTVIPNPNNVSSKTAK